MEIKLDFEGKSNTILEFKKVLLRDTKIEKLSVTTLEENLERISLEINADGLKIIFTLENYNAEVIEQKLVMTKAGLLLLFKKSYPWGALIGVRPTKLVRRFISVGYSFEKIDEILKKLYFVFPEKRSLLFQVIEKENKYLNEKGMNVYIGIPYCPTRCKYCSFASYEIQSKLGRYYSKFVETLIKEIKLTGKILEGKNYNIESLYFGGGTPSILKEKDLENIMKVLYENINLKNLKEFTFEAGREDTLNLSKLKLLKNIGVDRISLNPQSFNEEILKKLNRNFNRKHFDEMFKEIKKMGFIINMDLIIGLPGESVENILNTLEQLEKYDLDNLTIHTLAIKKGSKLVRENYKINTMDNKKIDEKIKKIVTQKNLHPYYLYRQKNTQDWGENIGYSVLGKESIFNIEMIEENQSTIGLGGGAISKKVERIDNTRFLIERYINPKDPYMYICEMEERLEHKKRLFDKMI